MVVGLLCYDFDRLIVGQTEYEMLELMKSSEWTQSVKKLVMSEK